VSVDLQENNCQPYVNSLCIRIYLAAKASVLSSCATVNVSSKFLSLWRK
jgi:hypothetical protein